MRVEYDPAKNAWNEDNRGLSFERARDFDFTDALAIPVLTKGEHRVFSVGYVDERLHILCYKPVHEGIRVISFRRANTREAMRYGKPIRRDS